MIYIMAFLFCGTLCLIAQIILDNTNLTPGHITSIYTVGGAVLSFLGIYDKIIAVCGAGATIAISNFGHSVYSSGLAGYYESGVLGIFSGLLCQPSLAIVSAVIFSFIFSLFFKPRD